MTEFVKNTLAKSGYHSIVHDITLGNHLEIIVDEDDNRKFGVTKKPKMDQTICGYVSGIYIEKGNPNETVLDLSPANPLALLKNNCPSERIDAIIPTKTKYITHYRKINPASNSI
jgi:hypothetical protein